MVNIWYKNIFFLRSGQIHSGKKRCRNKISGVKLEKIFGKNLAAFLKESSQNISMDNFFPFFFCCCPNICYTENLQCFSLRNETNFYSDIKSKMRPYKCLIYRIGIFWWYIHFLYVLKREHLFFNVYYAVKS